MNIRISGRGAHRANGLLELAGGNALTGWPNNVARIHGSCDRSRAIWARRCTAATAEEEHHSSRGSDLSDVNVPKNLLTPIAPAHQMLNSPSY